MAFSYFGSKSKVCHLYPPADHRRVFEPFCGSARYALRFYRRDVWINDLFPDVYKAWKWIVAASKEEIRGLPDLKVGESLKDHKYLSEEEMCVLGFTVNAGAATRHYQLTHRARGNIRRLKAHLLRLQGRLAHWKVTNLSYDQLPDVEASWYIDPPYQKMDKGASDKSRYVFGSEKIDYAVLGRWCLSRRGQVIVCEGRGADWLPFRKLFSIRKDTMRPDQTKEKTERYYEELIYHRQDKPAGFSFAKKVM
jgi:site-specific DNA-adenine methylase